MSTYAPGDFDNAGLPPGGPPPAGPPSPYPYLNHPAWGYPSTPYPTPPHELRPNRNAWWVSVAVAAFVGVAAGIVIGHWSVHNSAFVAGQATGIALLATVPVAIIAWFSRARWPLWRYPAIIVAVAVGLTLVSLVGNSADVGRTHQRRTAAIPETVGAWTRDDSPTAKAQLQKAEDKWQSSMGATGDTADMALYRSGGERAVLIVVTTRPGSRMDKETSDSPYQAVVDELAGAGVDQPSMVDARPLGGAMGCGRSAKSLQLYMCTWAELGMVGTIEFSDPQLTPATAAQITRDYRSSTEH